MTVIVSTPPPPASSAAREEAPARASGSRASQVTEHFSDDFERDLEKGKGSLRKDVFSFDNI
jgi:hypothetical protein